MTISQKKRRITMVNNLFKHEHPVHGKVLIKVVGNNFSFFSTNQQKIYGPSFSFKNKKDLMSKINGGFYYHPDDFTPDKAVKYISVDTDDEGQTVKKFKSETQSTQTTIDPVLKELTENFTIDRLITDEFVSINGYLSKNDIKALMKTSFYFYRVLFLLNRNKLYTRLTFFENESVSELIKKQEVVNLIIDTITTKNDEFKEFTSLKTIRVDQELLALHHNELMKIEHNKINNDDTGIKLVVEFKKGEFNLVHIPKNTYSLHIKSVSRFPIDKFAGKLRCENLGLFNCEPDVRGFLPDLTGVEDFRCNKIALGDSLPDTVKYAIFGFSSPGIEKLPPRLKTFSFGTAYQYPIRELPKTLTYLNIGPNISYQRVFNNENLQTFVSNLPKTLKTLLFHYSNRIPNDLITELPSELEKLSLSVAAFDFRNIKFPETIDFFEFFIRNDVYRAPITNWPPKMTQLNIVGGISDDNNNLTLENFPDSLKFIKFPDVTGFMDLKNVLKLPKNLTVFDSKFLNIEPEYLPDTIEQLIAWELLPIGNNPIKLPKNLKDLKYFSTDINPQFPSGLEALVITFRDLVDDEMITVNNLPPNLITFGLLASTHKFTVTYSIENNRNIKILMFMNVGYTDGRDVFNIKNSGDRLNIPNQLEELLINNSTGNYYGINLLTNSHPQLRIITARSNFILNNIFVEGFLSIPADFTGGLNNLRDDINTIVFDDGSSYNQYFNPPLFVEYIRLPKGYTHHERWLNKDRIIIDFNDM